MVWSWKTTTCYQAAIPYRAILPVGLDNVLVVGRSYSASHDALSLARMQRDMTSLGAGAGIAAAMSLESGVSLAELDPRILQQRWVESGTLRVEDLQTYGHVELDYDKSGAESDARALLKPDGCTPQLLARLARSEVSIEPLRKAMDIATDDVVKAHIARLLCLLGDDHGVDFLINRLWMQLEQGLPGPLEPTLSIPPEHGWAPEPVYSLHALAMVGVGIEIKPILSRIVAAVGERAEDFSRVDISPFEYVLAIATVVERTPSPELVEPLFSLLSRKCLYGQWISRYVNDGRATCDPVGERCAYLELCIARALARCGCRAGYIILNQYADDLRGTLSKSAMLELAELLGQHVHGSFEDRLVIIEKHFTQPVIRPRTEKIS